MLYEIAWTKFWTSKKYYLGKKRKESNVLSWIPSTTPSLMALISTARSSAVDKGLRKEGHISRSHCQALENNQLWVRQNIPSYPAPVPQPNRRETRKLKNFIFLSKHRAQGQQSPRTSRRSEDGQDDVWSKDRIPQETLRWGINFCSGHDYSTKER